MGPWDMAPRFILDEAPLSHPAHLDGLALFEDHGHRAVAAGELEHPPVGLTIVLHVVLHELDSAPLEVFAGGRAVGTSRRGVEFYWHALILAVCRSGVRRRRPGFDLVLSTIG